MTCQRIEGGEVSSYDLKKLHGKLGSCKVSHIEHQNAKVNKGVIFLLVLLALSVIAFAVLWGLGELYAFNPELTFIGQCGFGLSLGLFVITGGIAYHFGRKRVGYERVA